MWFYTTLPHDFTLQIESYLEYIENSYKFIEPVYQSFLDIERKILTFDELDRELFYSSPESDTHEMNEYMVQIWHGWVLVQIIQILEKLLVLICKLKKIEFDIRLLKEWPLYNVSQQDSYIRYKEIAIKSWNEKIIELDKIFSIYLSSAILQRNKVIHDPAYELDLSEFSKEKLIKLCKKVGNLLEILYLDWKSRYALDYLD